MLNIKRIFETIADAGQKILEKKSIKSIAKKRDLLDLCDDLLSTKGAAAPLVDSKSSQRSRRSLFFAMLLIDFFSKIFCPASAIVSKILFIFNMVFFIY